MMFGFTVLVLAALGARTVRCMFSVHDDVLAFPQYVVYFPDSFITEEGAEARLSLAASETSDPSSSADDPKAKNELYQVMWLEEKRFLCTIPLVAPPPPMNATERELSKVEEERELARATTRGWELLSDLDGKCLYFVSGWWSYSFCHNREIRQFHQLPPQHSNQWPPAEDTETQSYVLGQVSPEASTNLDKGEGTELQATGELRFLVQKMGGGTLCDLTGKERKIEVQFHCNSQGTDRIGWIKEVSICCYLMVVYTPRLCNDVAFLPPRENRANSVTCKQIMNPEQIDEYYQKKAKLEQADALKLLEKAAEDAKAVSGKKGEKKN